MEGHYIQGVGDHDTSKPDIVLLDGALAAANELLHGNKEVESRVERVSNLIEGFETPFGMELLSTVHWVCTKESENATTPEKALQLVHSWNERKKNLFSLEDIQVAWNRLREQRWI